VIRVVLPARLQQLARCDKEIRVEATATQRAVFDAIELQYPALRGTMRDPATQTRRAFVRFFACEEDLSHESPDAPLPAAVATGDEPLLVIGAMAGG
jgi:molybdopterin synthase sulfur carrier subunit